MHCSGDLAEGLWREIAWFSAGPIRTPLLLGKVTPRRPARDIAQNSSSAKRPGPPWKSLYVVTEKDGHSEARATARKGSTMPKGRAIRVLGITIRNERAQEAATIWPASERKTQLLVGLKLATGKRPASSIGNRISSP